MNIKSINQLEKKWKKQKYLTQNEIGKLKYYLIEVLTASEKLQKILGKDITSATSTDDPIKLAEALIIYDTFVDDYILYLKDAKKRFDKITGRLYKNYDKDE
jgi:hypothetical protein